MIQELKEPKTREMIDIEVSFEEINYIFFDGHDCKGEDCGVCMEKIHFTMDFAKLYERRFGRKYEWS